MSARSYLRNQEERDLWKGEALMSGKCVEKVEKY